MLELELSRQSVAWLAEVAEVPAARGRAAGWADVPTASRTASARLGASLELLENPPTWSPSLAQSERCRVLFDGVLYNRAELQATLAEALPADPSDAELVEQAYRRWGEGALLRLSGSFALLVWDYERAQVL